MTPQQRRRRLTQLPKKILPVEGGCWEWQGYIDPTSGYGRIRNDQENMLVHRMVYELAWGEIEDGMAIHHECENRKCANPYHLRQIHPADHVRIHEPHWHRWQRPEAA